MKRVADGILDVVFCGIKVTTTPGHRFWLATLEGWRPAGQLRAGSLLRNPAGEMVRIEYVSPVRYGSTTVYSIEVEEYHNYFVGGQKEAVWVHNGIAGGCGVPMPEDAAAATRQPVVGSGNAYSVAYEMRMEVPEVPIGTRDAHFQAANESLFAAMDADPEFAAQMRGTVADIDSVRGTAEAPENWVWNHLASEPGVMQLVPSVQHWSPNPLWSLFHPLTNGKNVGGFKIWGSQY